MGAQKRCNSVDSGGQDNMKEGHLSRVLNDDCVHQQSKEEGTVGAEAQRCETARLLC